MAESPLLEEIISRVQSLRRADTNTLRALRREYTQRLLTTSSKIVLRLAKKLASQDNDALRFLSYEILYTHLPALRSLRTRDLLQLGRNLTSWGAVDTFSCYLSGPAWRERQVPANLIHKWARSRNRWWRRAALVSTVPLNSRARGGRGDTARTLKVCRMLASDRDDMIVKAMSWALRELSKRDPAAVRGFLREQKSVLHARIQREVQNKLTTGLKYPRRQRK